ncbi:hypothetical protein GCM10009827_056830 [Dactylosporangium maewongense]|uniref:Uncharacterized protein n=1 Tax=Dactylosporangium maewongense TaxID=634393 RepID=A0ABN2B0Z9_9ACTN
MVAGVEQVLPLDFCVTLVRGAGPDEVIGILGGADPVPIVSAQTALLAEDAVREWVDEDGASHPTDLKYVVATRLGDWTMVIEPNGYLCTDRDVVRALSAAGELVSFYYNENTTPSFTWAAGGSELVCFNPGYPDDPYGAEPGRLDGLLTELGFTFGGYGEDLDDDGNGFDADFQERTFALMERMTGVRWDIELLDAATFHCAGVGGPGSRVATEPWYAEVREELTACAQDPYGWNDHDFGDFAGWRRRGVTDPRVKRALGHAGTTVLDEDRALALALAFAPAGLIERMDLWVRQQPYRVVGRLDEPWHGPAEDLCWQLATADGGGSTAERIADLWRDFPELRDVVIPPPQPPPPERAAVRRKREARERDEERWRLEDLRTTWGGRIPTDPRLFEPDVQLYTLGLVPYDRDLIDRIAGSDAGTQRAMALWAARFCCTRSGLIDKDWAEAGLIALERGAPPPSWLADHDAAYAHWRGVPRESIVHVGRLGLSGEEPPPPDPELAALHALVHAHHDDPLIAAMATVRPAVQFGDPPAVIAAFRAAFDLP